MSLIFYAICMLFNLSAKASDPIDDEEGGKKKNAKKNTSSSSNNYFQLNSGSSNSKRNQKNSPSSAQKESLDVQSLGKSEENLQSENNRNFNSKETVDMNQGKTEKKNTIKETLSPKFQSKALNTNSNNNNSNSNNNSKSNGTKLKTIINSHVNSKNNRRVNEKTTSANVKPKKNSINNTGGASKNNGSLSNSFLKSVSSDFDENLNFILSANFSNDLKFKLIRIFNWAERQKKCLKLPFNKTLIYPFGGGDILYPLVFFSDVHEFIVVGLEPAGTSLQPFLKIDEINSNLFSLYSCGYLKTREMESLASVGVVNLMYHQLRALKAKNIKITFSKKSFEITFILAKKNKKIIYYSLNLHNSNQETWLPILEKHKNFSLLFKGASYILQQKGFDKIRDFFIQRVDVIFQDDTGFGYQFLLRNDFKIKLFGFYFEPLVSDGFHIYFQPSLMKAYLLLEDGVNIFDISYNEPNWLIAFK